MDYGFSYTLYIIFFSNQVHVLFVEEKVGYDARGKAIRYERRSFAWDSGKA